MSHLERTAKTSLVPQPMIKYVLTRVAKNVLLYSPTRTVLIHITAPAILRGTPTETRAIKDTNNKKRTPRAASTTHTHQRVSHQRLRKHPVRRYFQSRTGRGPASSTSCRRIRRGLAYHTCSSASTADARRTCLSPCGGKWLENCGFHFKTDCKHAHNAQ